MRRLALIQRQGVIIVNPNQCNGIHNPNYATYPIHSHPTYPQNYSQAGYMPKPVYPASGPIVSNAPPSYESTTDFGQSAQQGYQNYNTMPNYTKS